MIRDHPFWKPATIMKLLQYTWQSEKDRSSPTIAGQRPLMWALSEATLRSRSQTEGEQLNGRA